MTYIHSHTTYVFTHMCTLAVVYCLGALFPPCMCLTLVNRNSSMLSALFFDMFEEMGHSAWVVGGAFMPLR